MGAMKLFGLLLIAALLYAVKSQEPELRRYLKVRQM
jgi:hypothetical protein